MLLDSMTGTIVAGRRNIGTRLFTFCFVIGAPAKGFIWICLWGMASAAIRIFRALQTRYTFPTELTAAIS